MSTMKSNKSSFTLSSLIVRGDNLNKKASNVNAQLSRMCGKSNIGFLDNSIILLEHIQRGGGNLGHLFKWKGVEVFFLN